jgi:hypothetical protein
VAEAEPARAVVGVHQVEHRRVAAERPAAPWARRGGVQGGDELGAQAVVGGRVAALLAGAALPVPLPASLPGAVVTAAGAADEPAAAQARTG